MSKQRRLRKDLKERYCFTQHLSPAAVERTLGMLYAREQVIEAATLQVGVVRLDAVLYWCCGSYQFGYDLLVKDTEDSPGWLCYESLPDPVQYSGTHFEREMFRVLDRAVEQFGLSYTQCRFPRVGGTDPKPK